jgi:hypothetical protein
MQNEHIVFPFEQMTLDNAAGQYLMGVTYQHVVDTAKRILGLDSIVVSYVDYDVVSAIRKTGLYRYVGAFSNVYPTHRINNKFETELDPRYENSIWVNDEHRILLVMGVILGVDTRATTFSYLCAKDYDTIESHLDYLQERHRQYHRNQVCVLTDTHQGLVIDYVDRNDSITLDDVFLPEHIKNEIYNSVDSFFVNGDSV